MFVFGKRTLALLHVWFVLAMILYLMYVGSKWLGGDPCPLRLHGHAYLDVKMWFPFLFPLDSYVQC